MPPAKAGRDTLWLLTVAPTIWIVHFHACYITAAIFCAKAGLPGAAAPLDGVRIAIAVFTMLALAGIGWGGAHVHRRWRFSLEEEVVHDQNTVNGRHRFLGHAAFLLCGLSAVATLYVALPAIFLPTCR